MTKAAKNKMDLCACAANSYQDLEDFGGRDEQDYNLSFRACLR